MYVLFPCDTIIFLNFSLSPPQLHGIPAVATTMSFVGLQSSHRRRFASLLIATVTQTKTFSSFIRNRNLKNIKNNKSNKKKKNKTKQNKSSLSFFVICCSHHLFITPITVVMAFHQWPLPPPCCPAATPRAPPTPAQGSSQAPPPLECLLPTPPPPT